MIEKSQNFQHFIAKSFLERGENVESGHGTYAYEICFFTELRSRIKDYSTIVVKFDEFADDKRLLE